MRNQAGFGVLSGLLCALCGVMLPLDIPLFLTFACFPDGRRRFIKPPKPLPTFLKDPYGKRNLSELLATNYEGCLHADKGFLPKDPWVVKGLRLKLTLGRDQGGVGPAQGLEHGLLRAQGGRSQGFHGGGRGARLDARDAGHVHLRMPPPGQNRPPRSGKGTPPAQSWSGPEPGGGELQRDARISAR